MSDELERSLEVDVLAAMLRADQRDSGDYLEHLATKLLGALPDFTQVERKGGFFSKHKPVQRITVELGQVRYGIAREKHGPVARRGKIVRGVALAAQEISIDEWTADLARAIKQLAESSAAAKSALEGFVFGK
jgi:hypothetical protein